MKKISITPPSIKAQIVTGIIVTILMYGCAIYGVISSHVVTTWFWLSFAVLMTVATMIDIYQYKDRNYNRE